MAKTYVAVYERDRVDDAWNVHVRGLDGCQSHARNLRQAKERIREALAVWVDTGPAALLIEDRVPANIAAVAKRSNRARREAERAVVRAQQDMASAAKELTKLGLSRRDVAELLGVSHQRIQQILAAG